MANSPARFSPVRKPKGEPAPGVACIAPGPVRRTALTCQNPAFLVTPSSAHEPQPHPTPTGRTADARSLVSPLTAGCCWSPCSGPANDPFVRGQRIIRMFARRVKEYSAENRSMFQAISAPAPEPQFVPAAMQTAGRENHPPAARNKTKSAGNRSVTCRFRPKRG
jgi:hypothetical protein